MAEVGAEKKDWGQEAEVGALKKGEHLTARVWRHQVGQPR